MAYGLSPLMFVEHGPANEAAAAGARRSSAAEYARAWQALTAERRLRLIEQALHGIRSKPA